MANIGDTIELIGEMVAEHSVDVYEVTLKVPPGVIQAMFTGATFIVNDYTLPKWNGRPVTIATSSGVSIKMEAEWLLKN